MLSKEKFYEHIKKDKYYKNKYYNISERIPTKDNKYDIYFWFYLDKKNMPCSGYRIYKHHSNTYVQETKNIDVVGLKINTDYKMYLYLKKEINKWYKELER